MGPGQTSTRALHSTTNLQVRRVPVWRPNSFTLSQHLSELEMGALYPLGLGHGVSAD